VKFGDVSAVELWHLFSSIVEGLFEPDENLEIFPPNEYITLLFTVTWENRINVSGWGREGAGGGVCGRFLVL